MLDGNFDRNWKRMIFKAIPVWPRAPKLFFYYNLVTYRQPMYIPCNKIRTALRRVYVCIPKGISPNAVLSTSLLLDQYHVDDTVWCFKNWQGNMHIIYIIQLAQLH